MVIGILLPSTAWYNGVKQHWPRLVLGWVTELVYSPVDETVNRGPLALLLQRQFEFPFGINIVQFIFFFFLIFNFFQSPWIRE